MTVTTTAPLPPAPVEARPGGTPQPPRPSQRSMLRAVLIRLHFLSGFLAAPIIVSLALTGILFAWSPQIETLLHRDALAASSSAADEPVPIGEQVRAAQEAHPGYEVTAVTPAAPEVFAGRETTQVAMKPTDAGPGAAFGHAAGAVSVYVDPGTAEVTGEIDEAHRPAEWLRNLHSSWRLGDNVAPLTELAASWLLVSMLTGAYLLWPTLRRSVTRAFLPRLRAPGWRRSYATHTALGLWLFVPLLALIVTGLTWTNFAGSRVDDLRASISRPNPSVTTALGGAAPTVADEHAEHDGAAAAPAGTATDPAFSVNAVTADQIDRVAGGVRDAGVSGLITFTPPTDADTAWTAATRDQLFPMRPQTLAVDGSTGEVVDRVQWDDRPLMAKLTSMGIAFHQAELFGIATQIYLTALALALIVLIAAGYRMWWLRRRPGSWGFPPRAGPWWRVVPAPVLVLFAALIYLMPTLGISLLAYLIIERVVHAVRYRREGSGARA